MSDLTVTINGETFGILETGFRRPSVADLLAQLRIDATDEANSFGPNADLRAHSPLGRWLAVLAKQEDRNWKQLEAYYYAGFVPTGTGTSLSNKCAEMGIAKTAATKAWTVLTLLGTAGTVIPAEDRWQASSGELFETLSQVVIGARGIADVKVEAVVAGADGNVAAGTIATQVNPISGVTSGSNTYDPGTTRILGSNDQGRIALAADGSKNDYQTVRVADISHPYCLDDLIVTVTNDAEPTPFTALFNFHLEVLDHATGELLGRTETQTFELDAGVSRTCQFTDEAIDISGCSSTYIRIVFVNEQMSEAILGLSYDDANQYQSGALYLNAVEQSGYDAVMSLISRLPGAATGGDDGETDTELRIRYLLTSATFGDATAEAVRSQLYRVTGVKAVTIRQNRLDTEVDEMNPHSIEATVYGGDPDDIGSALEASVPIGCETLGDSAVTVRDTVGQAHVYRYNKTTRVPIYIDITLTVNGSFSHALGLAEIRDALASYIGGVDSEGTFHIGLVPADDVIYRRVIALVMATAGVVDASVTLGITDDPSGTSNLTIDPGEIAETKLDYIDIEVSA